MCVRIVGGGGACVRGMQYGVYILFLRLYAYICVDLAKSSLVCLPLPVRYRPTEMSANS